MGSARMRHCATTPILALLACAAALLPRDEDALMTQTRADREEALRAARQQEPNAIFATPNPQTTWYLWPQETSCRGVVGDYKNHRLERLGKLWPDRSKWLCNTRALATQQPRCLVYAFGGHAEVDWDVAMTRHPGCEHYVFDPTAPCQEP